MNSLSTKAKLILIFLTCQALGLGAMMYAIQVSSQHYIDHVAHSALEDSRDAYSNYEQNDVRMMSALLESLTLNDKLQKLFKDKDRNKLLAAATPLFNSFRNKYGITHWYFHNLEDQTNVFLRVHNPALYGDQLNRKTYSDAIKTKNFSSGKELGKTAYALRVTHPFKSSDGKVIGYMELGEELDHFIEMIKQQTGNELAIVLDKKYVSEKDWDEVSANNKIRNTWNDYKDVVVTAATVNEPSIFQYNGKISEIPDSGLVLDPGKYKTLFFTRSLFPIFDSLKNKVGAVFVIKNVTPHHEEMVMVRRKIITISIFLSLLLSSFLVLYIKKCICPSNEG